MKSHFLNSDKLHLHMARPRSPTLYRPEWGRGKLGQFALHPRPLGNTIKEYKITLFYFGGGPDPKKTLGGPGHYSNLPHEKNRN